MTECDRCGKILGRTVHFMEFSNHYIQVWCHSCFKEEPDAGTEFFPDREEFEIGYASGESLE